MLEMVVLEIVVLEIVVLEMGTRVMSWIGLIYYALSVICKSYCIPKHHPRITIYLPRTNNYLPS